MNKRGISAYAAICLILMTAIAASTVTLLLTNAHSSSVVSDESPYSRLAEIQNLVETEYYLETDSQSLTTGAIRGMLGSLNDPYTFYYTQEELQKTQEEDSGMYHGVGMLLTSTEDGSISVLRVFRDSPAEQAGVQPGDWILAVDGTAVSATDSLGLSEVISQIRSGDGESVQLQLQRDSETLEVSIVFSDVTINYVEYQILDGDIGYLSLYQFVGNDVEGFSEALSAFREADVRGMIVDLRSNPGGYLDDVVEICDMLLPQGLIVYTEDRQMRRQEFYADEEYWDIPLAVLVNEHSASASEIFAAAIQEAQRGLIVGEKTYGKGVVQTLYTFPEGDGVQLTTSAYYTASGTSIHGTGVTPDIQAPTTDALVSFYAPDPKNDSQLATALDALRAQIAVSEPAA